MKPEISVIMSVYNAEEYVAVAIDSILRQTFGDLEFIIINDASTDDSQDIIDRYKRKDERIILINNKRNIGLTKSLNRGLRMARGKYIARMDADDISLPDRFRKQISYLESNKDVFLIGSSCFLIDEKGKKIGSRMYPNDFRSIKDKLKRQNCMIHPSIMFRNDKKTFYREKMWYVEDYDLYLNLLTKNKKIVNLKDKLLLYRITPDSVTKINSKKRKEFARMAIKFYNQRVESGRDEYAKFNPDVLLFSNNIREDVHGQVFMRILIEAHLKNGNFGKARKILHNKKTWQTIPFFRLLPYFVCAHIPFVYQIYRFCFFKGKRL